MKKILIPILILLSLEGYSQLHYVPARDGIVVNTPQSPAQGFSLDARSLKRDSIYNTRRWFVDTAEVNRWFNVKKYREGMFPISVNTGGVLANGKITGGITDLWFYKNGTEDSNLVKMSAGAVINLDSLRDGVSITVLNAVGTPSIFKNADEVKAGPISATDQTKINKVNFANTYTQLTTFSTYDTKTVYQYRYNSTSDNLYYEPGATDTPDSAMVFSVPGGRLKRYVHGYIDSRWFGAFAGQADSWPYLQKCANFITKHPEYPATLKLFRGPASNRFTISKTLFCANLDLATHMYIQATIKIEGDPGNTMLSTSPIQIYGNFKDAPVIAFQLCKGGGIDGVSILSPYVTPTLTAYQFYTTSISAFIDPTVRDSRYSAQCLIAVDAVRMGSLPPDGGYPTLTSYYTNASSQPNVGSGSTGMMFKDLQLQNGNIGIIYGVNGQTQNCEDMVVQDIYMTDCRFGFIGTQTEEKSNVYRHILAWGQIHTIFSNNDGYGQQGPGNFIIDNVQSAGRVNRFINWRVGGFISSHVSNIFAESLGTIGQLNAGQGPRLTVDNSIFRLATPEETGGLGNPHFMGGVMPRSHIFADNEVVFTKCDLMLFGTGLPVIIEGSPRFEHCTFEGYPSIPPPVYNSNIGGVVLSECNTTAYGYGGVIGEIGAKGTRYGAAYKFGGVSSYTPEGFTIAAQTGENYLRHQEYKITNSRLNDYIYAGSGTITVNSDRTVYLTHNNAFVLGQAIQISTSSDFSASRVLGVVTSKGVGGDTLSYVPPDIISGSYYLIFPYPKTLYEFMGNTTSGSPNVTLCKYGDWNVSIGSRIFGPNFPNGAVVANVSGTTVTFDQDLPYTITGEVFRSDGIQRININLANNTQAIDAVSNDAIFGIGDEMTGVYHGLYSVYQCVKEGLVNPTGGDARVAVFVDKYAAPSAPTITSTQVGYGDGSNLLTSSPNLTNDGSTVTIAGSGNGFLNIKGSGAVGNGVNLYSTNANSQSNLYWNDELNNFGGYGGQLYGNTTSTIGPLFGISSRANYFFSFSDGARNLGYVTGTLNAQPWIMGTNNIERFRMDASGHPIWTLGSDATNDFYYRNASGYFTRLPAPLRNGMRLNYVSGNYAWTDTLPAVDTSLYYKKTQVYNRTQSDSIAATGVTISSLTDSLNARFNTLDTTWHSVDFSSTTSATFNADTVTFSYGVNEVVRITAEVQAHKSTGESYMGTKTMFYNNIGGAYTDGTLSIRESDQYIPTGGLTTYTFNITRTAGRIFIQIVPESATITGNVTYQVKRFKL